MTTPQQQTSLFVGNLDVRVYRELLAEIFSLAGTVVQCHVVYDRTTGVSSGFGFVDYPDHETAKAAMDKFRGRSIYGQLLTIDWARASGPDAPAPNHCLFVGNLSPDITDEQLATAFSQFGVVASAKCAKDPATGKTQGFAFVAYQEKADAQSAMDAMNGQMLNNRSLRVDWAKGKASDDGSLPLDAIIAQTSINNVTAYVSGLRSETPEHELLFRPFRKVSEADVRLFEERHNDASLATFLRDYAEDGPAWQARVTEARDELLRTFATLETALAESPWLSGEDYGLADVSWVVNGHRLVQAGADLAAFPRCLDWTARATARPAFERAVTAYVPQ